MEWPEHLPLVGGGGVSVRTWYMDHEEWHLIHVM